MKRVLCAVFLVACLFFCARAEEDGALFVCYGGVTDSMNGMGSLEAVDCARENGVRALCVDIASSGGRAVLAAPEGQKAKGTYIGAAAFLKLYAGAFDTVVLRVRDSSAAQALAGDLEGTADGTGIVFLSARHADLSFLRERFPAAKVALYSKDMKGYEDAAKKAGGVDWMAVGVGYSNNVAVSHLRKLGYTPAVVGIFPQDRAQKAAENGCAVVIAPHDAIPGAAYELTDPSRRRGQEMLAYAGLYGDKADGAFRPSYTRALMALQKENGIEETGLPDEATLACIQKAYDDETAYRQVRLRVKPVLSYLGLYAGDAQDPAGDEEYVRAVTAVQQETGLPVTGICDSETEEAIRSLEEIRRERERVESENRVILSAHGYMESADGDLKKAITLLQWDAGLPRTGIADAETQYLIDHIDEEAARVREENEGNAMRLVNGLHVMRLAAHRGAGHSLYGENNKASILYAAGIGLDWVEFDVRITSDGMVIVQHDAAVVTPTGHKVGVRSSTLNELKNAKGSEVCTLNEILELEALYGKTVIVDVKDQSAALRAAALCTMPPFIGEGRAQAVLSTKDFDSALRVLDAYPQARVAYIVKDSDARLEKILSSRRSGDFYAVEINANAVTKEVCERIHMAGCLVISYIVDDEGWMRRLCADGVDVLMCETPEIRVGAGTK